MKKFVLFFMALLLWLAVPVNAKVVSGKCGDNVNWSLDTETGVLSITGSGDMYDFSYSYNYNTQSWYNTPSWSNYRSYIKSVSIADGVTSIGDKAFEGCSKLTSIDISNSVTSIGTAAFEDCTGLTAVHINDIAAWCNISFNGLYSNPLYFAHNLYLNGELVTNLEIPNGVTSIGKQAFEDCTGLTSVTIPNSVTSIGEKAFEGCSKLTSITIPNSVTSIGHSLFGGCSKLSSIYLVNEYSDYSFLYIPYSTVNIYTPGFNREALIEYVRNNANVMYGVNVRNILNVKFIDKFLPTVSFTVTPNYDGLTIKEIYVNDKLVEPNSNNEYCMIGLYPGSNPIRAVCDYFDGENTKEYTLTGNIQIVAPEIIPNLVDSTQTTLTFSVSGNSTNDSISHIEKGVEIYGNYYPVTADGTVTVTELTPGHKYYVTPYAKYDISGEERVYYGTSNDFSTKAVEAVCSVTKATATTLSFVGSYDTGDATFVACGFSGYEDAGETLTLTGLDPATEYSVSYYVTTEEGGTVTVTQTGTTEALAFTTLKAKATSNTRAVICAEANIGNEESGTGFEWRRVDAPDIVPSEQVGCAVHDGTMEGALSNLSANTYYQYRPYYTAVSGATYYGEWIGFGTADAYVYFTPTVHTYATVSAGANAVRLSGYALAGSDDILEQGFEYWADGAVTRSAGEVRKITASGQRMSVLLENLDYGTRYKYRAYVQTASETVYGEEFTFETAQGTGVNFVTNDAAGCCIYSSAGRIIVGGAPDGASVQIFSLGGSLVYSGSEGEIPVEQGVYIVRVAQQTKKVVVK